MPHTPDQLSLSYFENALDLICMADTSGNFLKLNAAWEHILGWPVEELVNKPCTDFIHPDDRERTLKSLENLLVGKKIIDFENRYQSKNGQFIWLQWRAHLCAEDNTIIFATARDITKTKEQQLNTSNDIRLLEMAEQTARVGHWHLDTASGELQWSNEIFKIYGRKPHKARITLDDFIDAFTPKDQKNVWALIQQVSYDGKDIEAEARLIRSDGDIRHVVLRAIGERAPNQHIKGVFGILQDVTTERQHQASMRSKDELMSMAFKATSDGIWDWDLKTDQVWFSPQWKAQLGYQEDEIQNSFESWADLIFEEDRIKAMDAIEDYFLNRSERFEMVQRFRHKKGHTVFILVRAYVMRDEFGKAIRLIGAHTDVSELKKLEQAKSEFTSIVSHELRTPLTAIHGAIGLLNGHYKTQMPADAQNLLQIADNNSVRLSLLINDILDMEKLQSGRMDFDMCKITLADFLPQIVENHLSYAKKYNVELKYDPTSSDLVIMGDSDRLTQVLSNLISNAIKFSNENGDVEVSAKLYRGQVAISIKDHGRGIPEELQNKIFDKFFQADSSDQRHKGGTGLGLSISKAMVDKMNGQISVLSEPNKGSTFTLTMPRA